MKKQNSCLILFTSCLLEAMVFAAYPCPMSCPGQLVITINFRFNFEDLSLSYFQLLLLNEETSLGEINMLSVASFLRLICLESRCYVVLSFDDTANGNRAVFICWYYCYMTCCPCVHIVHGTIKQ